MTNATFIHKLQADTEGLDFASLRQQALELVQQLSGDVWSDYNLHDPGVTILESLCYVLTELIYRCNFETADYLTQPNGQIDFERQALYRADQIFSSRALTANDYRKLMLGSVPNIDNIWLDQLRDAHGEPTGLYRYFVQLNERVSNLDHEGVQQAYAAMLNKTYCANRNLCEDLAEVVFVERVGFSLRGKIEIDGKREVAQLLAEIYFVCGQYLSPKVPMHSYADLHRAGHDLDELFCGVLSEHGYIADDELYPWRGYFSIAELLARISQIDGVKYVSELSFVDQHGKALNQIFLHRTQLEVAALTLPETDQEIQMVLLRAGKQYSVQARDVKLEFHRLDSRQQALRQQKQHFDWVQSLLPKAQYRRLDDYYPLQNHLPDIYGVNQYGVPEGETPLRKAQAAQLKAYLLFFEQLLANFLANLQQIHQLYSLDVDLAQSYFFQVLNNQTIAQVEQLYQQGIGEMATQLSQLLQHFDHVAERRNRVLDYLLAMYGEKFNQRALKYFFSADTSVEQHKIDNKRYFLRNMITLNKNRAAAVDYRRAESINDNDSGLKHKLNLLLGERFDDAQIIEHILLRPADMSRWDDFFAHRLTVLLPEAESEFRKLAEETILLNCPAHLYVQVCWLSPQQLEQYQQAQGERESLLAFLNSVHRS